MSENSEQECPECDDLRWIWEYGIEEKWPVQCPRCNWGCQHGEPYDLAYKQPPMHL
jgi:hypothetical protein